MDFTPRTEEELKKFELLPEGDYDFDVLQADDAMSKSGKQMIKLTLGVYASSGNRINVFDYLMSAVEYKLKHFCDSVGLVAEYQQGTLTADMCTNRSGRCSLKVQTDKSGQYDPKNVVKDYIAPNSTKDEDIPF